MKKPCVRHDWVRITIYDKKRIKELCEKYNYPDWTDRKLVWLWRCSKCKIDKPKAEGRETPIASL